MRDPLPFVKRFPDADMLVSTDELRNTTHDQDAQLKFLVKGGGIGGAPVLGDGQHRDDVVSIDEGESRNHEGVGGEFGG